MKSMIMGAENVRAILDGRKTRHSFPIKPQPPEGVTWVGWMLDSTARENTKHIGSACWTEGGHYFYAKPRYKVGEIVYVKETAYFETFHQQSDAEIKRDGYDPSIGVWVYKADEPDYPTITGSWASPLYMPESASRIHLEITGIKAQRVQDISWDECIREGISDMVIPENLENQEMYRWLEKEAFPDSLAGIISKLKDAYASLWDSINAKKGLPWESNPWVFVYTFKRVKEATDGK